MDNPRVGSRLRPLVVMALALSIALVSGLVFGAEAKAEARDFAARCYEIETEDVPFADAIDENSHDSQIWCYRNVREPQGARLVYNVDENGRTSPELSILIEADGTKTHASLKAGKLTYHKLKGRFNPLGNIPLRPPKNGILVREPISPQSAASIDRALSTLAAIDKIPHLPLIGEGQFSATSEVLPWRSFWFPHSSGRLHDGKKSPFAKYDLFLKRRAQVNPGAQLWESERHKWTGLKWAGHCNGWAAASILRPEPTMPVTDPHSGITFSVADLKGLWVETDYCPTSVFYGTRYRKNTPKPRDPLDITPPDFHHVLTYYIDQLKKPILMDYDPDEPVENRVVSSYNMNVKRVAAATFDVETKLIVHTYDIKHSDATGVAPHKIRHYKYRLQADEQGNIISGVWLSGNPDFLWVPVSTKTAKKCRNDEARNPIVDEFWVKEILSYAAPSSGPVDVPPAN